MGLLDELAGGLMGRGGAGAGLAGSVLSMLAGQGGQGGLASLVKSFSDKGLGDIVGSWVGTGANLPISPQQIQQGLGAQQLQALAAQHGLSADGAAQALSQLLPGIVDKLTPGGHVPDPSSVLQGIASLKGRL